MALTLEQMRLVAEGMFRDSKMIGYKRLKDRKGTEAVLVRVFKADGGSGRVFFPPAAPPVEVPSSKRYWLAWMLRNGRTIQAAAAALLRMESGADSAQNTESCQCS